jgi:hypothetical protein
MDNKLGVNLNVVSSFGPVSVSDSGDALAYPDPIGYMPKLGDRVQGNNGSEWMYVKAGLTVTAFNAVAINPNFSVQNLAASLITSNAYSYGVAQFQPVNVSVGAAGGGVANAGEFFWALLKANSGIRINATGTNSPGDGLYISMTNSGRVAGASSIGLIASGGRLNGLMFLGSVSIDAITASSSASEFGMFSYIAPAGQWAAITV